MINSGYDDLGSRVGYVFGTIMAIWAVMAWSYIPETRLRSYGEVDEMVTNHIPTRKFRKHKTMAEVRTENAYRLEQRALEVKYDERFLQNLLLEL